MARGFGQAIINPSPAEAKRHATNKARFAAVTKNKPGYTGRVPRTEGSFASARSYAGNANRAGGSQQYHVIPVGSPGSGRYAVAYRRHPAGSSRGGQFKGKG